MVKETRQEGNIHILDVSGDLKTKVAFLQKIISIGDAVVYKPIIPVGKNISFSSTVFAQGSKQTGWNIGYKDIVFAEDLSDLVPANELLTENVLIIGSKTFPKDLQKLEMRFSHISGNLF